MTGGWLVGAFTNWLLNRPVTEARTTAAPPKTPERAGFEHGIPRGGLDEYNTGVGASTQTDRASQLQELYESYLSCPWSWACVNAIARTVTAGGLVTDWDADDGEGDQDQPDKPPAVLALERLLMYVNPREDVRQLLRSTISDLLVFGDAFIEVVWAGAFPVALYTLDAPSTTPIADEHGTITGYVQSTQFGQRAQFEPRDVIHVSLDAPRSGVLGVSPTQAALLPITMWLFCAATTKELFRKGNPPVLWADMPAATSVSEQNRWRTQYAAQNLGPRNIGVPIVTRGGAHVQEFQPGKIGDYLATLAEARDQILAAYGVPPAEAGVIETGNIGSGTGESQRKTFIVNTCNPIAALVLEKLNFHIVREGFNIAGWHLKFGEVDMRDSKTIEDIRDARLRNGSWTLNKYRTEIGEPPVPGGDEAVLVDRQNLVLWRDMEAFSTAGVAQKLKGSALEPGEPQAGQPVELEKPEPAPVPAALQGFAGQNHPPGDDQPADQETPKDDADVSNETWRRAYRDRLREALNELPHVDADPAA